ncbi:MAG: two-component system, OmpR family, sensor kinase [Chloroflexia bacterium]|nr:two-component system, OmpR family, sensor kinase [Chloroflexia bacterium]
MGASTLRLQLSRRVGYWRALGEFLLLGFCFLIAVYLLAPLIGPPWAGVLNYLSFCVYGLAAWRLSPGGGDPFRRLVRLLSWGTLLGLLGGLVGYISVRLLPYSPAFLGYRIDDERISLNQFLFGAVLSVLTPFLLTRALVWLWTLGHIHLRWRLTYSYLLVAVLMVLLFTPVQSLYLAVQSLAIVPPVQNPEAIARSALPVLEPLVAQGASPERLSGVLQAMLENRATLPLSSGDTGNHVPSAPLGSSSGVRRLLIMRPDGTTLARAGPTPDEADSGSGPGGNATSGSEAAELAPLLSALHGGECVLGHPGSGPIGDTAACSMLDTQGKVAAYLVVESSVDSATQFNASINRIVTLTLASTVSNAYLLLFGLSGMLLIAGVVGYLLTRPITRRIERLAAATDDLAAGNLGVRVEVESADELGRLNSGFNSMAGRLEEREAALNLEKERAESLLQANRRLVADVSHELRTPLATLKGYLDVLEQDYGHQLPAQDLAVIQKEMSRLTSLIDDLFTLARAEAKQLPLKLETVDARAVAYSLAETVAPIAQRERQIEVVTALPAYLPSVRVDRKRFEQVLLNLLQNALRYTPPGGLVVVEGESADGVVTLSVNDTGVGIPAEELPLVFERFYRSDSSRARESGGAGIGLALVGELVAAMGGSVSVQSTPGRGSRFSVSFVQAT